MYAQKILLKSEEKKIEKKVYNNFFFVLKSSETFATKILPLALFEGGGLQIINPLLQLPSFFNKKNV